MKTIANVETFIVLRLMLIFDVKFTFVPKLSYSILLYLSKLLINWGKVWLPEKRAYALGMVACVSIKKKSVEIPTSTKQKMGKDIKK